MYLPYIIVAMIVIVAAIQFIQPTARAIRRTAIREWIDITEPSELHAALADITATPFGNVGQDIGYRITDEMCESVCSWDFDEQLNAYYALTHRHYRLRTGKLKFTHLGYAINMFAVEPEINYAGE